MGRDPNSIVQHQYFPISSKSNRRHSRHVNAHLFSTAGIDHNLNVLLISFYDSTIFIFRNVASMPTLSTAGVDHDLNELSTLLSLFVFILLCCYYYDALFLLLLLLLLVITVIFMTQMCYEYYYYDAFLFVIGIITSIKNTTIIIIIIIIIMKSLFICY